MINDLQEKLQSLQNEKNVVERKMSLRRERHNEEMEALKKDYQDKNWKNTGAPVLTDTYMKELEDKFEEGLAQEFDQELEELDEKMGNTRNELKDELTTEIANKDNELQDKSHQIEGKKGEIDTINAEILKASRLVEPDFVLVESLKNNRASLEEELNKMLEEQGTVEKEKEELKAILEELEPEKQDGKKNDYGIQELIDKYLGKEEPEEPLVEKAKQEEPLAEEEPEQEEQPEQEEPSTEEQPEQEEPEQEQPEEEQPEEEQPLRPRARLIVDKNIKKLEILVNNKGIHLGLKNSYGQHVDDDKKDYTDFADTNITSMDGINQETVDEALKIGDKYIVGKILLSAKQERLTLKQTEDYLNKYIQLYKNPDGIQNYGIFNIHYNIKGLRNSTLTKQEREDIENNARIAKKLGIDKPEAGVLTKIKWFAQDVAEKVKRKVVAIGKPINGAVELLEEHEQEDNEQLTDNDTPQTKFRRGYAVDTARVETQEQEEVDETIEEAKESEETEQDEECK